MRKNVRTMTKNFLHVTLKQIISNYQNYQSKIFNKETLLSGIFSQILHLWLLHNKSPFQFATWNSLKHRSPSKRIKSDQKSVIWKKFVIQKVVIMNTKEATKYFWFVSWIFIGSLTLTFGSFVALWVTRMQSTSFESQTRKN